MSAGCWVTGVAVWLPGFPDATAWRGGVADPEVVRPGAALLPSRQRRRCTVLTRALVEVFAAAAEAGGVEAARAASIFASAYGETKTMIDLLAMLHDDGVLSPTKFAGSVHNTASGNATIATSWTGFTTSLAAGPDTPAMALLEAQAWLAARGGRVVLALGDMVPPEVLVEDARSFETLAVGLVLAAEPEPGAAARLDAPRIDASPPLRGPLSDRLRRNPCSGALELADALLGLEGPVGVRLDSGRGAGWSVRVTPTEGA